jgi:hypothetical protein
MLMKDECGFLFFPIYRFLCIQTPRKNYTKVGCIEIVLNFTIYIKQTLWLSRLVPYHNSFSFFSFINYRFI